MFLNRVQDLDDPVLKAIYTNVDRLIGLRIRPELDAHLGGDHRWTPFGPSIVAISTVLIARIVIAVAGMASTWLGIAKVTISVSMATMKIAALRPTSPGILSLAFKLLPIDGIAALFVEAKSVLSINHLILLIYNE